MSHTNLYMSWTPVTITPLNGTAVNMKEVIEVDFVEDEDVELWQSDGNPFPTLGIASRAMRGCTITGGDVYKLSTIPRNTPCVIYAVLNDAVNQNGGSGSVQHTLVNAILTKAPRSGVTNKYAGGSASFVAYSIDGVTDPLTTFQVP